MACAGANKPDTLSAWQAMPHWLDRHSTKLPQVSKSRSRASHKHERAAGGVGARQRAALAGRSWSCGFATAHWEVPGWLAGSYVRLIDRRTKEFGLGSDRATGLICIKCHGSGALNGFTGFTAIHSRRDAVARALAFVNQ